MTPTMGNPEMWTVGMRVGRFLYKSVYLFGPIASCLFFVALIRWRSTMRALIERVTSERRQLLTYAGIVVANVVLFFAFPIEISYLIPGLFFLVLLAAVTIFRSPRWAWAMAAAIALECVATISFARPNIPGRATSAKVDLSVEAGDVVRSVQLRRLLMGCESYACWHDRMSADERTDQATH